MATGSDATFELMDSVQLAANTGDDAELALEILGLFKEQIEMWSRMLDPNLDPKQWADAAHTLKGAALGAGAMRFANACARAEEIGREKGGVSKTEAAVALSEIKDQTGATLEAVAQLAHHLTVSGSFPSTASKDSNS